jgi:translation initiation factor eIF-2B subunit alpha/methylthioribose-1-phosphate isomerase
MQVNGKQYRAVWWDNGVIKYVDQRLIPYRFEVAEARSVDDVAEAIVSMGVRGAPTIGVMAAYGLALAAGSGHDIGDAYRILAATRPTAVNLKVGLDRVIGDDASGILGAAREFDESEVVAAEAIGEHGSALIDSGTRILTHCNTGWLAAQDWGTAASVIFKSQRAGKSPFVFVSETRPRLQGARLTAWEMTNEGVDHVVIADSSSAFLMKRGEIDIVITGADRIAANGDSANKIGTYAHALAAKAHGIPFYIAAPKSTIDLATATGDDIEIEERDEDEVLSVRGVDADGIMRMVRIASAESGARNPAFDVTPAEFISGIITESGVVEPSTEAISAHLR